jgi:hypothetical protein
MKEQREVGRSPCLTPKGPRKKSTKIIEMVIKAHTSLKKMSAK